MDNDIYIPFKFRASQIVGLTKVAAKYIETNGIKLKELGQFANANRVGWFSPVSGKLKEAITGAEIKEETGGPTFIHHILELIAGELLGEGELTGDGPSLTLDYCPGEKGSRILARVNGLEEPLVTILDEKNRSSFLKLLTLANLHLSFGTSTATWAAAQFSSKIVAHGLGVVPQLVIIGGQNSNLSYGAPVGGRTKTQLEVSGFSSAAITGTFGFDWLAIG